MDCQEVKKQVTAILDHEIGSKEADEVLTHLKKCKHCFTHYEIAKILKELVRKCHTQECLQPAAKQKIEQLIRDFDI